MAGSILLDRHQRQAWRKHVDLLIQLAAIVFALVDPAHSQGMFDAGVSETDVLDGDRRHIGPTTTGLGGPGPAGVFETPRLALLPEAQRKLASWSQVESFRLSSTRPIALPSFRTAILWITPRRRRSYTARVSPVSRWTHCAGPVQVEGPRGTDSMNRPIGRRRSRLPSQSPPRINSGGMKRVRVAGS